VEALDVLDGLPSSDGYVPLIISRQAERWGRNVAVWLIPVAVQE
jgi:hypothetical protein